ncbi:MAG: hypothetical protein HON57_05355 [Flavobacteriaceae bacterium]|nr:hypothetical protein [Candidatus Arcticimaribacter sp.]MDG1272361.1 hypothetical protein [Flavobacteriaceae bacterium]
MRIRFGFRRLPLFSLELTTLYKKWGIYNEALPSFINPTALLHPHSI